MKTACRWGVMAACVLVCGLWAVQNVAAQRGMSSQARKMMQQQMQQQQQYQQNVAKAQQKKDKELMDRFDTNKNGKIDPSEKTAWNKYWRDVRLGKTPHPYATIKPEDLNPTTAGKNGNQAKPANNTGT